MFRSPCFRSFLLVLPAVLASACSSGTDPEPPGAAAALRPASDTVLAAVVGTTLPDSLVVQVVDDRGRGVPSQTVSWSGGVTGATLSPSLGISDQQGRARSSLGLSLVAGEYTVVAQTVTGDGVSEVRFRIISAPGPAATLQVAPQDPRIVVGDSTRLSLTATDQYGNGITGRPVTWSSADPAVALVNPQTGMIRGIAPGFTTITVTTEGKSASVSLTVVGQDTFDSNTLNLYTQYADIPVTWSIAGGVLTAGGAGRQSAFIRNDAMIRDGWVEAEMDRADEGGLVLRFQDQGNYYLVSLEDDSSLLGHRNLEIFKRTAGQWQILSTRDIVWPRGTVKTIRFEANGSTLMVYVDGVLMSTVNDASIQGAGRVGMRYNDVSEAPGTDFARYLTFRWLGRL